MKAKQEAARTRPAKYWEQPELQQAQETEMRQAARQAAIEHDRRNKLTKSQRVGRIAVGGVANSIILAHNTKVLTKGAGALLGKDTHTAIARRSEAVAPRLRQKHEVRQSSEVAPSRIRRLGNMAVKASVVAAEAITRRSSKRAARLSEKTARLESDFTQKRGGGRLVSAARAYKEDRASEKRRVQSERRKAADEGVLKYREAHPEIAERERKEQLEQFRHETRVNLGFKLDYSVEYFRDRNAYSFLKSIPRRPSYEGQPGFTGDYAKLAKSSLTSAMTYRQKDGSIPLLGGRLEQKRLADLEENGKSVSAIRQHESRYIDGVSTALWQLGFVQVDKEEDIPYSRGNFNPNIEWEESQDAVKARLPFDPNNELHAMLVSDDSTASERMIELTMPRVEYGYNGRVPNGYMAMRVMDSVPATVAA